MSRKTIVDEFSDLPISRQRKYQLRRERDSLCTECGAPSIAGKRCLEHLMKARERERKKKGLKRRNLGALSYQLENNPNLFTKLRKLLKEAASASASAKSKAIVKRVPRKKAAKTVSHHAGG